MNNANHSFDEKNNYEKEEEIILSKETVQNY